MKRAFTLIELMICIAIVAIIAAIAIPNMIEAQKAQIGEVSVSYRDIVGKTFLWNGNKTLIVDYNGDWKYVVVIMPDKGGAVNAIADRKIIMEAYKASLNTPKNIPAEKVEQ
jgi:prepilin-type N-terminal cleavage/methylation domain-containing protein